MARTLQDDMAADFADLMLNTDEFAETVTFYPANGDDSRQIAMHLSRVQSAEDGIAVQSDSDTLIAHVLKDSSHDKGGIPIEELESGLRPTLVRDSDFNWTQHVAEQIDDRLTGVDLDLFSAYTEPSGTYTWSATCWAAEFDFTCVSFYNSTPNNYPATLISLQHVIMASHHVIAAGRTLTFIGGDGTAVTRDLEAVTALAGSTDISIGYLSEPMPDGWTFCPILPADYDDYFDSGNDDEPLYDLPVITLNAAREAGVQEIMDDTFGQNIVTRRQGTGYPSGPLTGDRDDYFKRLGDGDSGYPTLMPLGFDKKLVLIGLHWGSLEDSNPIYSKDWVPSVPGSDGINDVMTALDTDETGYQLTEFDLTRPTPGRFVFTGDILGETPHSWTLRFIRAKGYRTGGGARRS